MQDTRVREWGFQNGSRKATVLGNVQQVLFPLVTSKQAVHEAVTVKPKS